MGTNEPVQIRMKLGRLARRLSQQELGDCSQHYGRRVSDYAVSQMGQTVGNGECWTLAKHALESANAREVRRFNFGHAIELKDIEEGDILQFHECQFEWVADGMRHWVTAGDPHHTAIALGPIDAKGEVKVLEQNVSGKRFVVEGRYRLYDLKKGKVEAWRPVHQHHDHEHDEHHH